MSKVHEALEQENILLREALAVLSTKVLKFNDRGISPLYQEFVDNEVVRWALDQARLCHAWVACGPTPYGMTDLFQRIAEDIQEGKRGLVSGGSTRKEER